MKIGFVACVVCGLLLGGRVRAAEYFVSPRGNDGANGLSQAAAFQTIGKGAALLKPGDTLTILPGEYFESLSLNLSGTKEAPITIRAQRPGTVLMRGDVDLDALEPAEGLRYTWTRSFDRDVQSVGERDTGILYAFVPSAQEVQAVRGSCYYDKEAKRLYVHTSDSAPPSHHAMVALVTYGFGLYIGPVRGEETAHDVIVDGLAFSGYVTRDIAPRPGSNTRWGLFINEAERCVIRRCTAFLNGGGICMVRPIDCIIEDCLAFGNASNYNTSGGNIISWTPARNTIMRRNVAHSTLTNGIRFYGNGAVDCLMESNIAWDCGYGEMWIKGGDNSTSRMERNISLGALNVGSSNPQNTQWNIYRTCSRPEVSQNNIKLNNDLYPQNDNFASPEHRDYRLQSDSALRGKGPDGTDPGPYPYRDEVFFVSSKGDDAKAGTSLKLAWRTLQRAAEAVQPGHTVYVLPGTYPGFTPARSGTASAPIVFRARGGEVGLGLLPGSRNDAPATSIRLDGRSFIRIEGFTLGGGLSAVESNDCGLLRCRITMPVSVAKSTRFFMKNCSMPQVSLAECGETELTGNLFTKLSALPLPMRVDDASLAGLWSDYNAFPAGAKPAAPGAREVADLAAWRAATGLDLRSVTMPDLADAPENVLAGRGPLSTNIGPATARRVQAPVRIENASVLSVSATTANIEWWTPNAEAATTLEWGPTPACASKLTSVHSGSIYHTVSLTGLTPGTKYYYRLGATTPVWEYHTDEELAAQEEAKVRQVQQTEVAEFVTAANDPEPRTLHVALTGNDANDGLTTATAWRTLRHAAVSIHAGDTVLVHEGTYEENVPVRVTGDAGRPVTFRAAPGEKVWIDGSGQKRPVAFLLSFKNHVVLDGFYFRNFRAKPYNESDTGGLLRVIGGSHNTVRRCFYDGRAQTYMPHFIEAEDTSDFLLENSVVILGWHNVVFARSPNLMMRNNVFYNGLLCVATARNGAREPVTMSHNLICDVSLQKVGLGMIQLSHLEAYRGDHNVFFARLAEDKRIVVASTYAGGKRTEGGDKTAGGKTLPQLRSATKQEMNSRFANPGIRVTPEMKLAYGEEAHRRAELHRTGSKMDPLDFADFIPDPNGPCARAADGKPIGPDPSAFADHVGKWTR